GAEAVGQQFGDRVDATARQIAVASNDLNIVFGNVAGFEDDLTAAATGCDDFRAGRGIVGRVANDRDGFEVEVTSRIGCCNGRDLGAHANLIGRIFQVGAPVDIAAARAHGGAD